VSRILAQVFWLALVLAAMILSIFGSLTGFIFHPWPVPVLWDLLLLHLLLNGIIGWDIYVVPD
jgi:hypothetical protein